MEVVEFIDKTDEGWLYFCACDNCGKTGSFHFENKHE